MAGPDLRFANIVAGHSRVWRQRGFTLVELIVVMVIIGVLGAVGGARFFDRRGFDVNGFAEQTRAMLRFGQKLAIAQNRPVFVQLNSPAIALCFSSTAPCPAASQVPGLNTNSGSASCTPASWYCNTPPPNIVYAISPATANSLCFNALGQPGNGGANDSCSTTFGGLAVNITGDGNTTAIGVAQETGYVF